MYTKIYDFIQITKRFVSPDLAEKIEKIITIFKSNMNSWEIKYLNTIVPSIHYNVDPNTFVTEFIRFWFRFAEWLTTKYDIRLSGNIIAYIRKLSKASIHPHYFNIFGKFVEKEYIDDVALNVIYLVKELVNMSKDVSQNLVKEINMV